MGMKFELEPVDEKPDRKYTKGSKYDPILDKFMKGKQDLVVVKVSGKDPNYLRTQLMKRIEARELGKEIEVSVINNETYLEKK